jgi:hypothetical protein
MVATCDEKTTLHEHEEGFQVVMMIKGENYYLNLEMPIKKIRWHILLDKYYNSIIFNSFNSINRLINEVY